MARNLTMMTDFYEFTMSQAYFKAGKKDETVLFDAFFRKNPLKGGYGVMGGVDKIIDFIKNIHFTEEELKLIKA
jgi:nicotinate phosphoribosyltransferase